MKLSLLIQHLNKLPQDAELTIRDWSGDAAYGIDPGQIETEKRTDGEILLVLDLDPTADFVLDDDSKWEKI